MFYILYILMILSCSGASIATENRDSYFSRGDDRYGISADSYPSQYARDGEDIKAAHAQTLARKPPKTKAEAIQKILVARKKYVDYLLLEKRDKLRALMTLKGSALLITEWKLFNEPGLVELVWNKAKEIWKTAPHKDKSSSRRRDEDETVILFYQERLKRPDLSEEDRKEITEALEELDYHADTSKTPSPYLNAGEGEATIKENEKVYFEMGEICYYLGKKEHARRYYLKALKNRRLKLRDQGKSHESLGYIYADMGNVTVASTQFQLAIKIFTLVIRGLEREFDKEITFPIYRDEVEDHRGMYRRKVSRENRQQGIEINDLRGRQQRMRAKLESFSKMPKNKKHDETKVSSELGHHAPTSQTPSPYPHAGAGEATILDSTKDLIESFIEEKKLSSRRMSKEMFDKQLAASGIVLKNSFVKNVITFMRSHSSEDLYDFYYLLALKDFPPELGGLQTLFSYLQEHTTHWGCSPFEMLNIRWNYHRSNHPREYPNDSFTSVEKDIKKLISEISRISESTNLLNVYKHKLCHIIKNALQRENPAHFVYSALTHFVYSAVKAAAPGVVA